ncbi:MAG: ATP-binding protein [Prolixibacteraceae bacterium]
MGKVLNVLLVEDNPGDAFLVEEMLEEIPDYNFSITHVDTLKKTITQLQHEKYDVILLDLGLPDSKELYALESVLALEPDSPVVVVTGLKDGATGQNAIKLGAKSYLVKGEFTRHSVLQNILFSIERSKFLKRLKENKSELKKKNDQLEESNTAKNLMMSIISHDLRGPINSVNSLLDIMNSEYDSLDDASKKRYLKSILSSAQNTHDLMENLLQWAQIQTKRRKVEPEEIEVKELIREGTEPLQSIAAEKEITIDITVPENKTVYADKKMITTVIRNLVNNSLKFSQRGGEINIFTQISKKGNVEINVKDSGVGIENTTINKLFQYGKTSSSKGTENETGSGFGLILCKELIEKNNGELIIESEKGDGTTVRFNLPVA